MSRKNESHHDGSYMVIRNLHAIKHALEEIMPLVDEHDDIESWMEHKVSVAKEALSAVRDALLYDDEEGEESDGGMDISILRGDEHRHDDMGLSKILGGGCGANESKFYLGSGAINEKKQLVTNNSNLKVLVESVEKVGNMLRVTTKAGKSYEYMPHFGAELEIMRADGYGIKIVNEMHALGDEEDRYDMKSEMKDYLKNSFGAEADDFSMEEAIYWFAHDYHGGQASDLYSILSTSEFKPSRLHHGIEDSDDEMSKMMYEALVEKYGK